MTLKVQAQTGNPYNLHKLRKCIPPNCHPYFRILAYDPPPCFPPWIPTRPLGQVDALQISTHGIWCMFGGDHTLPSSDQKRHRPGLKCKQLTTHKFDMSDISYNWKIYIYTTYLKLIRSPFFCCFRLEGFSTRSVALGWKGDRDSAKKNTTKEWWTMDDGWL